MARGWAISGIGGEVREATMAAADKAGMPVSAWVEQALRQALEAKAEPAPSSPSLRSVGNGLRL